MRAGRPPGRPDGDFVITNNGVRVPSSTPATRRSCSNRASPSCWKVTGRAGVRQRPHHGQAHRQLHRCPSRPAQDPAPERPRRRHERRRRRERRPPRPGGRRGRRVTLAIGLVRGRPSLLRAGPDLHLADPARRRGGGPRHGAGPADPRLLHQLRGQQRQPRPRRRSSPSPACGRPSRARSCCGP